MQPGPESKLTAKLHSPPVICEANLEAIAKAIPDLISLIFGLLPPKQFLPMRALNKRCKAIIEASLINTHVRPSQICLFESQQNEIDCLLANKKAILRTPKYGSGVVRPDDELKKAFAEVEKLPNVHSSFSLYRRHLALNDINIHIIYNRLNYEHLSDMFTFNKVIDLSGLYLTRLPSDLFELFCNQGFYRLPIVLCAANNCLTQIPLSLTRLFNLKVLDLSANKLQAIPYNIHAFTELETLLLANNYIETIPLELVRLPKLRTLDVRRNCLRALPEELSSLKLKRPREALKIMSPNINYEQYSANLPEFLSISKPQLLSTQRGIHFEVDEVNRVLATLSMSSRRT